MVMLRNFPVETVVGSHLQAAVTMKASSGHAIIHNYLKLTVTTVEFLVLLLKLMCHVQVPIFTDVMLLVLQ